MAFGIFFERFIPHESVEERRPTVATVLPGTFPRHHRRGSIEALAPIGFPHPARPFRDIIVAAPLKHVPQHLVLWLGANFPRHHRRGSIEASRLGRRSRCPRDFPRPHRRGSIEAKYYPRRQRLARGGFPRHHRRGSIEAGNSCRSKRQIEPFRDIIVAAPLKLFIRSLVLVLSSDFPRHHRPGSIEALMPLPKVMTERNFPRHHRRGSIEAAKGG